MVVMVSSVVSRTKRKLPAAQLAVKKTSDLSSLNVTEGLSKHPGRLFSFFLGAGLPLTNIFYGLFTRCILVCQLTAKYIM